MDAGAQSSMAEDAVQAFEEAISMGQVTPSCRNRWTSVVR